jgi:putative transposase
MHASPLRSLASARPRGPRPRSLGSIVGSFKSAVTKQINDYWGTPSSPIWQRNYHDRIIRNGSEIDRIRKYIDDNPATWLSGRDNPAYVPPLR